LAYCGKNQRDVSPEKGGGSDMGELLTRMGDGTRDAADNADVSPLTEDEQDHLDEWGEG
jgi:hypothetical protein